MRTQHLSAGDQPTDQSPSQQPPFLHVIIGRGNDEPLHSKISAKKCRLSRPNWHDGIEKGRVPRITLPKMLLPASSEL